MIRMDYELYMVLANNWKVYVILDMANGGK